MSERVNSDLKDRLFKIQFDPSNPKVFLSEANEFLYDFRQITNEKEERGKDLAEFLDAILGKDIPTRSIAKKAFRKLGDFASTDSPTANVAQDILDIAENRIQIEQKIKDHSAESNERLIKYTSLSNFHIICLGKNIISPSDNAKCRDTLNHVSDLLPKVASSVWGNCIPFILAIILSDDIDAAFLDNCTSSLNRAKSYGKAGTTDAVGLYFPPAGLVIKGWNELVEGQNHYAKEIGKAGAKYERVSIYKKRLDITLKIISELEEARHDALCHTDELLA